MQVGQFDPAEDEAEIKEAAANLSASSKFKTPVPAAGGMTPWDAAKRVRVLARDIRRLLRKESNSYSECMYATDSYLEHLETLLRGRSSKDARLGALERVRIQINWERNAAQQAMELEALPAVEELWKLSQHLQTTPNASLATREGNIVRAFVAILRSNGVIE